MSNEVINVGGEEKTVREDTAKSYRGTIWALISVGAFIVIGAIIFFFLSIKSATDGRPNESPAQIEQRRQQ